MALDAVETKKQENCSRIFFEAYIESGKKLTMQELKKTYPEINAKWYNTFDLQATAMKNWLQNKKHKKGFNYSRDDGIMPFLVEISSKHCGVRNKDSWNTMDIVMVKKSDEAKIQDEINKFCKTSNADNNLQNLNGLMRKFFTNGTLYGVSLKDVTGKEATIEVSNLEDPTEISGFQEVDPERFKMVKGSLRCNLQITDKFFDTGEAAAGFIIDGKGVNVQHRNFRYSQGRGVVQTDLTGKGAAAKLGKASAGRLTEFLADFGIEKPESPGKDPNIDMPGKWTEKNIQYWVKFYNSIKDGTVAGAKVDFGNVQCKVGKEIRKGFKEVLEYAVLQESKNVANAAGRLSSKLVGLRWIQVYQLMDTMGILEKWISVLYYSAKKEGSSKNGVFIKIA
jgi:hypothetical protein